MARMRYTATIECDGVTSEPLEIEVTITEHQGLKSGRGSIAIPSSLVGVAMNTSTHATVRTVEGEEFLILFTRILFPEAVGEFVTSGPVPMGRKVA